MMKYTYKIQKLNDYGELLHCLIIAMSKKNIFFIN